MLEMKPSMITNVNSIFSKVRAAGEQEKIGASDHTPPTISVGDTVFQVTIFSFTLFTFSFIWISFSFSLLIFRTLFSFSYSLTFTSFTFSFILITFILRFSFLSHFYTFSFIFGFHFHSPYFLLDIHNFLLYFPCFVSCWTAMTFCWHLTSSHWRSEFCPHFFISFASCSEAWTHVKYIRKWNFPLISWAAIIQLVVWCKKLTTKWYVAIS